ncbi:MAG TPA: glycosyltransferase, partial [Planctomycetes bacterium]|nr:glycosyltransferase [Planctomycetota bacterium]
MAPPRIHIVLPAYNAAATIGRALASLAAQTFEDWEC